MGTRDASQRAEAFARLDTLRNENRGLQDALAAGAPAPRHAHGHGGFATVAFLLAGALAALLTALLTFEALLTR